MLNNKIIYNIKNTKIYKYFSSHIWVQIICSLFCMLLVILLIYEYYQRNHYYTYFVNQTQNTEQSVLYASTDALNSSLYNALRISSEIANSVNLKNSVDKTAEKNLKTGFYAEAELKNELANLSNYSDDIATIAIFSVDEPFLYEYWCYNNQTNISKFWEDEKIDTLYKFYYEIMQKLENKQIGYYSLSTDPPFRDSYPKMRMFHIAVPLLGDERNLTRVNSIVVISFCVDNMLGTASIIDDNEQSSVSRFITDENNIILFHENEDCIGSSADEYINQKNIVDIKRKLDIFNWIIHITIDKNELLKDVDTVLQNAAIIYISLILLLFFLWQMILHKVLKPIEIVENAIMNIQGGKQQKIEVNGNNEIWKLAEEYNKMIDALCKQRELIENEHQEKLILVELKKQAEKKALESQINSHFLFNTMNAINYSAIENDDYEVSSLIKQLSNILQYTLTTRESVTVGEEIHWLNQYFALQKNRLKDKFNYEIDFPEQYNEWPCCKLFLQPFAENTISHGFDGIDKGGLIKIKGYEEKNRLVIILQDNGCGIEPNIADKINSYFKTSQNFGLQSKGNGIAICNVITRMKMFFGEGFDMDLKTELGKGTCFTFWLPLPSVED